MEYNIDAIISDIKNLNQSTLTLYNCILLEKRSIPNSSLKDIVDFNTLLKIIEECFDKFKNEENLRNFMPILHHTIHLTTTPQSEIIEHLEKFISNRKDKNEAVILQFIHQILLTLSEKGLIDVRRFEKNFTELIVSWIFSIDILVQTRSISCALILLENFHYSEIIDSIEIRLLDPIESSTKKIDIIIQLIDSLLNKNNIFKENHFWKILHDCFKQSNDSHVKRKQIKFIIKSVLDHFLNKGYSEKFEVEHYFVWNPLNAKSIYDSWTIYLTVLENLEERQSHLIIPSLQMLEKINVPLMWKEILFVELLSHRNSLVLKWSIQYVLKTFSTKDLKPELIIKFLEALNNTFLYGDKSFQLEEYESFFNGNRLTFMVAFSSINWKSVPMHMCLKAIKRFEKDSFLLPYSTLFEITIRIRKIQNKCIREQLRNILFEIFIQEIDEMSFSDFCKLIETLYNCNEKMNSMIESIFYKKFNENTKEGPISRISLEIFQMILKGNFENNFKEIFLEYLLVSDIVLLEDILSIPLMKGFDEIFLPKIINTIEEKYHSPTKCIDNSMKINLLELLISLYKNKSSNYEIINLSMEVIKRNFNKIDGNYLRDCNLNRIKQLFVDNYSTILVTTNEIHLFLENVEIFLDTGGYRTVQNLIKLLENISVNISEEVLDRILGEIKILIKKHGYSFCEEICMSLANYLTSQRPEIFYNYLVKLLDLDPFCNALVTTVYRVLLNSTKYDLHIFETFYGGALLIRGLLFGEPLYGDQKIEYDYCHGNELFSPFYHDSSEVRLNCLKLLYKIKENLSKSHDEKEEIFESIRNHLLNISVQLNVKKSRYFDNSKQHRLKLRIMQSLAVIQKISNIWNDKFLAAIFEESNQNNITFLAEIIIADCISKTKLLDLLKECSSKSISSLCSLFSITFMVCKKYNDQEFTKKCITLILPWTMGQHFSTRLYGQITIFHLIASFKLHEYFPYLKIAIQESLKQGNVDDNMRKLNKDFRYNNLNYTNLLDTRNILVHIPRITNMASDELYQNFHMNLLNAEETDCAMQNVENFPIARKTVENYANTDGVMVDEVQRKMNILQTDFDPKFIFVNDVKENIQNDMIVVASLITKLPNLGGIARTCEVLGIKNLIVNSLKIAENKEFQSLSMTAEKWLQLFEVKSENLQKFLTEKKTEGYSVIGAEQTSNSVNFAEFKFPTKCILLLGHEKEGIPANLISLLDCAVEIPQFGMVRSLNVHVTGALFMWEYCKQNLLQINK